MNTLFLTRYENALVDCQRAPCVPCVVRAHMQDDPVPVPCRLKRLVHAPKTGSLPCGLQCRGFRCHRSGVGSR